MKFSLVLIFCFLSSSSFAHSDWELKESNLYKNIIAIEKYAIGIRGIREIYFICDTKNKNSLKIALFSLDQDKNILEKVKTRSLKVIFSKDLKLNVSLITDGIKPDINGYYKLVQISEPSERSNIQKIIKHLNNAKDNIFFVMADNKFSFFLPADDPNNAIPNFIQKCEIE